jgi:CheY-like chemotaxis protein
VVDDSPEFLSLIRDMVSPPAVVECFDSPDTTVDDVALAAPGLVIVDLKLGGGSSGWELLRACRADPRLEAIPLVLCSADIRGLDERQAEIASMGVAVLRKPFTLEEFEALLAGALEGSIA